MPGRSRERNDRDGKLQISWSRDWIILIVMIAVLLAIGVRLCYVQILKGPEYADMAATAHTTDVTISARRGTIYDRNGEVIASNIQATTIYANPQEVTQPVNLAQVLEEVLGPRYGLTYDDYYSMVTKDETSFVYLHRKADVKLAKKLRKTLEGLKLEGIHYLEDTKRVYPNEETGSQVIGVVDVDGKGIAGLEMQYNDMLGGTDGEMSIEQGMHEIPISNGVISKVDAIDGEDMVTSLDIKLQAKVEKSLLEAIEEYKGKGGTATVMDAATGEIYAACSYGKGADGDLQLEVGKLGAATDAYEPGSTYKAITAASVFTYSKVKATTVFDVPAYLRVYDHTVTDSHDHPDQSMSFRKIIADSSNIGTVLASRKVKQDELYKTYSKFGFGSNPGTDFPGVTAGQLEEPADWDGVQAANITFGQGVLVSGLQILRAYGALEQDGTAHIPHFLIDLPNNEEKAKEYAEKYGATTTAAKAKVCNRVTSLLKSVVTEGTGTDAKIAGFTVAGKTGTAEVAKNTGGYYEDKYIVSFCGWLEGSSSDLVCLVTVNEPKSDAGGGPIAGPAFADIMSFAAKRYQIQPKVD